MPSGGVESPVVAPSKTTQFCSRGRVVIYAIALITLAAVIVVAVGLSGQVEEFNIRSMFESSEESSARPSAAPSDAPTDAPSVDPTAAPHDAPSSSPTGAPSDAPTAAPTFFPTMSPTAFVIPQNPEPLDPPPGYFNYDSNSTYGPHNWEFIDTSQSFMKEFGPEGFGAWKGHFGVNATTNICGSIPSQQSPRDLNNGTKDCEAIHMIRTRCGDLGVSRQEMEKQILPHKLSIRVTRRPCLDVVESNQQQCRGTQKPPTADYPMYTFNQTAYSDLFNWDIKVPSEHTIRGERFDAEIQMFHGFPTEPRRSSIGVPVTATPDGHNVEFQHILDHFKFQYFKNLSKCKDKRRRDRHLRGVVADDLDEELAGIEEELASIEERLVAVEESDAEFNMDESANYDDPEARRRLYRGKFNPYSAALMPGMFFYRYRGSLTEPPCTVITWFIMHEPMIISIDQLLMVKRVLFTNVDENCNPTSVHNGDMSVARPLFGDNENVADGIQDCAAGTFLSDVEKGRDPGIECRNQF